MWGNRRVNDEPNQTPLPWGPDLSAPPPPRPPPTPLPPPTLIPSAAMTTLVQSVGPQLTNHWPRYGPSAQKDKSYCLYITRGDSD